MEHLTIEANGASFHVARTGSGPALILHREDPDPASREVDGFFARQGWR